MQLCTKFWIVTMMFLSTAVGQAQQHSPDNQLTDREKQEGWILLFDGSTYAGWMTSDKMPSRREIEHGLINPHRCGAYMMVHKRKWTNFVLQLDFKQSANCNSGVFFRVHSLNSLPGHDVGFNGLEVAIDDTKNAGYHDAGAIYDLAKPVRNTCKPIGEWNHLVLTCAGSKVLVALNGEGINCIDLDQFEVPGLRPDGSKHKFGFAYKDHPRTGYIGLQDHGADIWFKNIKLLPLRDGP